MCVTNMPPHTDRNIYIYILHLMHVIRNFQDDTDELAASFPLADGVCVGMCLVVFVYLVKEPNVRAVHSSLSITYSCQVL